MKKNLFLIGFRCAGKSVVGLRLAQGLGRRFVDTDRAIEARAGRSIAEIISAEGWPGFRRREAEALAEISREAQQVVATGGGIVLDPENVRCMKAHGVVVFLEATVETIRRRMANDPASAARRPALTDRGPETEIRHVLAARLPVYAAAAEYCVNTDGKGIDAICEEILVQTGLPAAPPERCRRPHPTSTTTKGM